jgi:hypothetical protein
MNKHVSSFTHQPKSNWNSTSLLYVTIVVASLTTRTTIWFLFLCETWYEGRFTEHHAKLSLTARTMTNYIKGPLRRLLREGYYLIARTNLIHFTITFTLLKHKVSICFGHHLPIRSRTIPREQYTSITARYTHQNCVRVVPPEDGQVMPETYRGFVF